MNEQDYRLAAENAKIKYYALLCALSILFVFLLIMILNSDFWGVFKWIVIACVAVLLYIPVFLTRSGWKRAEAALARHLRSEEEMAKLQKQWELERAERGRLKQEKDRRNREVYTRLLEGMRQVPLVISEESLPPLDVDDMPEPKRAAYRRETQNTLSDFVVIDVETTGLSARHDKIVELSAIRFSNWQPIEYVSTLVDPRVPIGEKASAISGITDDMVAGQPTIEQIAPAVARFIGKERVVVGHNLPFDIGFFYAAGIDLFLPKRKFFDTLALAQRCLVRYSPNRDEYDVRNHKLSTLVEYYDLPIPESHRSLADCIATGLLFRELLDEIDAM